MTKKHLECPCGARTEFKDSNVGAYDVGETARQTGWNPIPVSVPDYLTLWLCPKCWAKVLPLTRQIAGITKNPFVEVSMLMTKEERDRWSNNLMVATKKPFSSEPKAQV